MPFRPAQLEASGECRNARVTPRVSPRVAVALLFFINGFTYGTWVAHLPLLKARLALSDGALGIALLAAAVASLITLPLAGRWIAQRGSHGISIVASLAAMPTLVLPYIAPTYVTLLLATFALGVAYSAMDVAMNAQAVLVERRSARPIMSSFHGLFSAGGLAGALVTAIALARGGSALGDTLAVAAFAELTLAGAIASLVRDAMAARDAERVAANAPPSRECKPRRRELARAVARLGVLAFFGLVGEGAMADWSAIYVRTSLSASVATAAMGFGVFSCAMAVGRFMGDALVARFGGKIALATGAGLAASALAIPLVVHTLWATFAGFALVGLGLANVIPVTFSIAGRMRGLGAGVGIAGVSTLGYAGFLVGPPLIGFVSDALGLRVALGLVVLGIAAIAPLARGIDEGAFAPG